MRVADRMKRNPRTCAPEVTINAARLIMQETGVRSLPVVKDERLVGIVTDRDIRSVLLPRDVPELLRERMDLLRLRRVADIMTPSPLTIGPEASLERAAELVRRKQINGLPVVRDGRLVGFIAQREILGGLLESLGTHRDSFRFTLRASRRGSPHLSQLLGLIESQGAEILSVVSEPEQKPSTPDIRYVIRVRRAKPGILLPYLREVGLEVEDVIEESIVPPS